MKKIISQNIRDFNDFRDVNVRRLDGYLHDSLQQIKNSIKKMEELRSTRPDITLQEIQKEGIFDYEFQMIPNYSKYFEKGIFGQSSGLKTYGSKKSFTIEESRNIGKEIGIKWDKVNFSIEQFSMGLNAEHNEHGTDPETNVTHGDIHMEGKIAWAHLKEMSDYYTKLKKMENS